MPARLAIALALGPLVTGALAPMASAQGNRTDASPEPVTLRLDVATPGEQQPRQPDLGLGAPERERERAAGPWRIVGSRTAFRLGDVREPATDEAALKRVLRRLFDDDDRWYRRTPDADPEPPALRFEIADDVRCRDVVRALDLAIEVGYERILVHEGEPSWHPMITFVTLTAPQPTDRIVPPPAAFALPYEPDEYDYRILDLEQDGRVRPGVELFDAKRDRWHDEPIVSDDTLAEPGKPGLRRLRRELLAWRADAIEKGRFKERRVGRRTRKVVDDVVVLHADQWVEWRHVRAILDLCASPRLGLLRVQLAACEEDVEGAHVNRTERKRDR